MRLDTFDPHSPDHIAAATGIWNAACGAGLSFSERFMRYNTDPAFWRPAEGKWHAGRVAVLDGRAAGFVLASVLKEPYAAAPYGGHLDAIAVLPEYQRRGIGRALVGWAEGWMRAQGCERFRARLQLPHLRAGTAGRTGHPGVLPAAGLCAERRLQVRGHGARPGGIRHASHVHEGEGRRSASGAPGGHRRAARLSQARVPGRLVLTSAWNC